MSKPSAPPAPDYAGAAKAQGVANLETAIATAKLNNPWTQNAYGSRRVLYGNDAGTGDKLVPRIIDEMTPLGERRAAQEQRIIGSLGDTAESGLYRVGQAFGNPMEFGDISSLQDAAQTSIMNRLTPIMNQRQDRLENQLANQGISDRNSEAYRTAMDEFNRSRNDAESQAVMQAIGLQPQLMQQSLAIRNQPLNELNALRTGSQVTLPNFGPFRGAAVSDTPIMQATMADAQNQMGLYNSQMGAYNNMMSGLFGLGGMGALGYFGRK